MRQYILHFLKLRIKSTTQNPYRCLSNNTARMVDEDKDMFEEKLSKLKLNETMLFQDIEITRIV